MLEMIVLMSRDGQHFQNHKSRYRNNSRERKDMWDDHGCDGQTRSRSPKYSYSETLTHGPKFSSMNKVQKESLNKYITDLLENVELDAQYFVECETVYSGRRLPKYQKNVLQVRRESQATSKEPLSQKTYPSQSPP
jgi:hypothetical protein